MNRSLSMILWGVLFTSVVVGALTLSGLKLLHWREAGAAAPSQQLSTSQAPPVIVGTEHPIAVNPTPVVTPNSRHMSREPLTTATSQKASSAENGSQPEADSPKELVRAKAEEAREKAERMRAQVEDLYQQRRISEAAYKKAQADYQHELSKYEHQIAKYRGSVPATGADND